MFKKLEGHKCGISTGICGRLTFGTGKLDPNGYWENSCEECARAWEKQFPEDAPCRPPGETMDDKYVVMVGDMFGPKTVHGPFEDAAMWSESPKQRATAWAKRFAQGQHWEIIKLED